MNAPTAFPLAWPAGWPRTEARKRQSSRFRTGYLGAYDNLMAQLRMLGASGVIVSSNAPIRRDGKPYADAMKDDLADPGVAVYFTLPTGPRVMARDGHPTPAENLHAVGHVIEHLRGIERHGGGYMMERAFSAFAELPAPGAPVKRPWREVFGFAPDAVASRDLIEAGYRMIAKQRHPDAPGGSHDAMAELNAARDAALREVAP
jgi:hypothetical protein